MLIGFILFFTGIFFMKNPELSDPSMYLLFVPLIYIAEILNDYFQWWHTPVNLPEDRKALRFLLLESVLILLPVLLYYAVYEDVSTLLSFHAFVSICLIGLGFKYAILGLGRFFEKNFSRKTV